MIDKIKLKKMLGEVFSDAGFVKKGQTWYLSGNDAVVVINLQKSDHADKFYLNIGIWLKALGLNDFPKENHCQIQVRLGGLFPEHVSVVDKALNLEFSEQSDIANLIDILRRQLIPFCKSSLCLEGLKKNGAQQLFSRALIFKQAKELLELD